MISLEAQFNGPKYWLKALQKILKTFREMSHLEFRKSSQFSLYFEIFVRAFVCGVVYTLCTCSIKFTRWR